jgi:hypothetical protein
MGASLSHWGVPHSTWRWRPCLVYPRCAESLPVEMEHPPTPVLNLDYCNTMETGSVLMELICVSGLFAEVFVRLFHEIGVSEPNEIWGTS